MKNLWEPVGFTPNFTLGIKARGKDGVATRKEGACFPVDSVEYPHSLGERFNISHVLRTHHICYISGRFVGTH